MWVVETHVNRTEAVVTSLLPDTARVDPLTELSAFRQGFYDCLTARADALFETVDAMLTVDGPVVSVPELSLTDAFRRGHGSLYDALAAGEIDSARLTGLIRPRPGEPWMFALDVSAYERPDARCSPELQHCFVPCRCDGRRQTVPGWPYSWLVAVAWGRSSWVTPVDARRVRPHEDANTVAAEQIRRLIDWLTDAALLSAADPPPIVFLDAGYSGAELADALADVHVQLVVRLRSDRVFYGPPRRRPDGRGRPARHGERLSCKAPLRRPDTCETKDSPHHGRVEVLTWAEQHQKIHRNPVWDQRYPVGTQLPTIGGTLLRVRVERLPDGRKPPADVWLWHHGPAAVDTDLVWFGYLRRFDVEHFFKFAKGQLGWNKARLRHPAQADRWTRLVIAAYTQLRIARRLGADLRAPWQRRLRDGEQLTPYRTRRGFRRIRTACGLPAGAPKPTRPGPGRPKGSTTGPAKRYPVGKKSAKPDTP
jgi:hypothetical protein